MRQRALLAVLLLRAGEPVSRERVIADPWGERPPERAIKTVQAVVSRLRRALGGEAARVVSSAAGYRLRVEPDELDLGRFERLCGEGRRALAAGRHERAAARLRAALAEWRGPPLADVSFEPFAPPEVARLEDLRAAALEDRVDADLAIGRGAELVGELEGLVAAEPLRERLHGQLMLALYRAGRQGEALDVYREVVRTLDSELGLRPGPELGLSEHEDARRGMADGETKLPATFFVARAHVVRAHAARERDDRDAAREAFEVALDEGLLDLPHGPTWTISLTWAADICAWLEDRPRAARLYDLLAPFADVMTYQYGPVGRAVGRLAKTLEHHDEAEQLLRDAVALCERMDARAFLAMARQDLGELLLPSPEGRRLLEQARAAAEELDMPGLTKRAVAAHE